MNITLPPEFQELIQKRVDSGEFAGPDEVIEYAFKLLEAHDAKLRQLRELIEEGDRAIREGRTRPWTPELREELNRRARAAVDRGERPDVDVAS